MLLAFSQAWWFHAAMSSKKWKAKLFDVSEERQKWKEQRCHSSCILRMDSQDDMAFLGLLSESGSYSANQVICYPDTFCKSNSGLRQQFCSLSGCREATGLLQAMEEGIGACRKRLIETLRGETRWKGPRKDNFFTVPAIPSKTEE